jgi:hypothetical protein
MDHFCENSEKQASVELDRIAAISPKPLLP